MIKVSYLSFHHADSDRFHDFVIENKNEKIGFRKLSEK